MKPTNIFIAVIAVSILLIGFLPRLGHASSAPALPITQAAIEPLPIVTVNPTAAVEPQPAVNPPAPTVKEQTAAAAPPENEKQAEAAISNEAGSIDLPVDAGEDFQKFVSSVHNGKQGAIVGIYAPGLFGMPVTGQPGGDENFISTDENMLTQYTKPAEYGVTALLAHNYLNSGKLLSKIQPDQAIFVVYGDGKVSKYQVSKIEYFQALSPHDNRSDFRDLNGPNGEVISYSTLFDRVYTKSRKLVFQTCLEANGELSWGRVFISADPAS